MVHFSPSRTARMMSASRVDVPVRVDVAGGLDRGVPEQFLGHFRVPGDIENTLTGGMPRLVHPRAACRPRLHNPGPLETGVPPVVQAVVAHRLVQEPTHLVLDCLAVLVRDARVFCCGIR